MPQATVVLQGSAMCLSQPSIVIILEVETPFQPSSTHAAGDWDAAGQRDAAQPGEGDSQDSDADAFGEFEDMEAGKRFGADGDATTATALQVIPLL